MCIGDIGGEAAAVSVNAPTLIHGPHTAVIMDARRSDYYTNPKARFETRTGRSDPSFRAPVRRGAHRTTKIPRRTSGAGLRNVL